MAGTDVSSICSTCQRSYPDSARQLRITTIRESLTRAFSPVDGATLGVFRIAWGVIMMLEAHWLWQQTRDLHSPDFIHFHFQGFSWIRHFPEGWMTQLEIATLMLAAIFIAAGFLYRPAII